MCRENAGVALAAAASEANLVGLAVVFTERGQAAQVVSKYRPAVPVVVVSGAHCVKPTVECCCDNLTQPTCCDPPPKIAGIERCTSSRYALSHLECRCQATPIHTYIIWPHPS